MNKALAIPRSLLADTARVWLELMKIMVPIIIVVKVLKEFDLIRYAAMPLEPIMTLVGLPGDMGLVWATAIINNLYAGIVVYAALIQDTGPLTVAQVTVLCTMMLIAHNMPLELRIVQKCGASFWGQALIRLGGALLCGMLMHLAFDGMNVFQEQSRLLWSAPETGGDLTQWALGQARGLGWIFLIILTIMAAMRLLDFLRITELFTWLLRPILKLMGIGPKAATITIIGQVMGIAYGGGLMIHEAKKGLMSPRDLFSALSLMGLTHALVEDTLLMMLMGGHPAGILWCRLAFSLVAVAVLGRVFEYFHPQPPAQAT